jgi:FkbM family methyltransferase
MTHWSDRLLLSVKRGGRRAGLELMRYNATNALDAQRARLIVCSDVDLVVDVGANEGQWASDLRHAGYLGRIVSFEPLAEARTVLERAAAKDPNWSCRPEAASDRTGESNLHVAANSVSSSLLEMAEPHVAAAPGSAIVGSQHVRTVRLDDAGLRGARIMLKLDTQGAELDALAGASALLDSVVLVELEVSFKQLYVGGPLWRDTVDYLGARGYDLAALSATWVDDRTGRMLQADAVFVRA